MQHFQNVQCRDRGFFLFICQHFPKMYLSKGFIFKNLGAPRKTQFHCFVLRPPCMQHFKNVQSPDSVFFIFICQHLLKLYLSKGFILEILGAPRKKQCYCLVRGAPYMQHFQNIKCSDSGCFILISHYSPKLYVQK